MVACILKLLYSGGVGGGGDSISLVWFTRRRGFSSTWFGEAGCLLGKVTLQNVFNMLCTIHQSISIQKEGGGAEVRGTK